jgi:transcriptional regulator with XRE-family HTH domain
VAFVPRDRPELGIFLRARRDQLTPAQAGIEPFPGARRVPGLRRDELAMLAGLSPDYYSRVEQGRQANVSVEVLDALGRALRLTDVERDHLHDLAAPTSPRRRTVTEAPQRADPGLLRVMTTLDHVPVVLLGHRGEVLASNALLRTVLGAAIEPGSSFPRFMFLDPTARERITNWADFARATIGALRRETGRRPHDRKLGALVDELRAGDEDAARWWDDQAVRDYTSVAKRILHPAGGELLFDIEILTGPQDPEQRLVVYTCEPDSPTARTLSLLASWTDTNDMTPSVSRRSRDGR